MSMREQVSLVRCPSTSDDAQVVQRSQCAIEQLKEFDVPLRKARRIAVKINAGVHRVVLTDGKQTELTEPAVVEGAIRAIRGVTDAEILIGDGTTDGNSSELYRKLGYPERLAPYANVRLVDFNTEELVDVVMPHSWAMFRSYRLPRSLAEADTFVSLAKMKAHAGMGCTLSIKNLFGWIPTAVYGTPRLYLHDRLIRLPRVLLDLAAWSKPCLNVVDAIVAANKSEWHGTPMRPGVILAGTNCVATDSVGMRVMGFDPAGDYLDHPFFYRRSVVKLGMEQGLGPMHQDEVEVTGLSSDEVQQPFYVERYHGDTHRDEQIRRGAVCVARYREKQNLLARTHRDRYLALFDGEVLWEGQDVAEIYRKEHESGRDWHNVPQFVVRCLPAEEEIEQMDWYATEVARLIPSQT